MKTTIATLILALVSILIVGCHSPDHGSGHHQGAELNLQLDNGNKWIANPETQTGFENIQKQLRLFAKEKAVLTDYNELGDELQAEIDNVVQQCTMKGKGHEELHKLLIPVIASIKDLRGDDLMTCKRAFSELEMLAEKYFEYFKL